MRAATAIPKGMEAGRVGAREHRLTALLLSRHSRAGDDQLFATTAPERGGWLRCGCGGCSPKDSSVALSSRPVGGLRNPAPGHSATMKRFPKRRSVPGRTQAARAAGGRARLSVQACWGRSGRGKRDDGRRAFWVDGFRIFGVEPCNSATPYTVRD